MLKKLFKWGLILLLLGVALVVGLFLCRNALFRLAVERNIHQQTGLIAKIGAFRVGLRHPTIEIKNLRLYNPPQFGHTPLVSIPEIYAEYDRDALAKNQFHVTLLRFNLGELDVVKSADGQTNLLSLGLTLPAKKPAARALESPARANAAPVLPDLKKQTGLGFAGIDRLDVSVGTLKYIDLQNQKNNREQPINIRDCILTNVTSSEDIYGLAAIVGLRSGDFFAPLIDPHNSGSSSSVQDLLKLLGR